MPTASELLHLHFDTFAADHQKWKRNIAANIVWELAFAPSLGHPARLSGSEEVFKHIGWFVNAVTDFKFIERKVMALPNPAEAVAQAKAEGRVKSTGAIYRQEYVVFLEATSDGKIGYVREYFDPARAAKAFGLTLPDLEPWL